ncbi:MAG: hypothetical protein KF887_08555 [Paracoccaceae bacterium]|nr:MAG: hypothetical protein KF887_08555 [Paracoccaceae bacterium]
MGARRILRALAVIAAVGMAAASGAGPAPGTAEGRFLSVEEARAMGIAAIEAARPDVAADIARQMLAKDAADPFARFLLARALMEMGDLASARGEARLAFRHARSREQRHQAARLAALVAWNDGRHSVAQYWLHRSALAAPAEVSRTERLRELSAVRAANPVDVSFGFSAIPTDNVNDGASSEFNIIDGVPVVGWLSPDGQALPGVVSHLRAGIGYRLPEVQNLRVGLSVDWRRVDLSSAARARVPDLDPRSFDSGRVEVGLRRTWRPEGSPWMAQAGLTAGVQINGRDTAYRYARLDGAVMRGIGNATGVDAGFAIERRGAQGSQTDPAWAKSLSLGLRRLIGDDGGQLTTRVYVSRYDTPIAGRSSETLGLDVSYSFGQPLGPAMIALQAGYAETRFPDYMVGFIVVPGGRQDRSVNAALTATFPKYAVGAFEPRLTISHGRTDSNVSRFDTRRSGISLGLNASF